MKKDSNMSLPPVPKCGSSDKRNEEYDAQFSHEKYYRFLVKSGVPIIFDIGAHRGESVVFFRSIFPEANIFSFEPEPTNFQALKNVAHEHNAKPFNLALSSKNEDVVFFKQDISHLGGLIPINQKSSDSLGYAEKAKNEEISVTSLTLDSFCSQNFVQEIDLLKIDVQGHELEVLRGAGIMLQNTHCVTVEISLYDFYGQNTNALLDVEKIMAANDFALWDIAKISKNPKNLRTDWIEAVYRKNIQPE
ncbi:MAG: FkbM family methyltransferase [Rhodospirillales bacterium]|nr:FkbM family methyltransferase [Rhodospirillales bacterium]